MSKLNKEEVKISSILESDEATKTTIPLFLRVLWETANHSLVNSTPVVPPSRFLSSIEEYFV